MSKICAEILIYVDKAEPWDLSWVQRVQNCLGLNEWLIFFYWNEQMRKVISCVNRCNSFVFLLGIQDFPENIKCCKCLTIIEASVNPISK